MGKIAKLSKENVDKVSSLAQLPISDKEKEGLANQLSKIIGYFEEIQEFHTSGVEPIFNVAESNTVVREDKADTLSSQGEALKNASRKKNGFFVIDSLFQR